MKIRLLESGEVYSEFSGLLESQSLRDTLESCIRSQKRAAATHYERFFTPAVNALQLVSEERLAAIIKGGRDIHGISAEADISNVISFNNTKLESTVVSDEVAELRSRIDDQVIDAIRITFSLPASCRVTQSGHFWYPPGGYMSWHTNSRSPGWRFYVTHAEQPLESFFRYRHPETHDIHTSLDPSWGVRLFYVDARRPFWHAVYSNTHRFSFGYVVHEASFKSTMWRLASKVRRVGRTARPA